MSSADAKAPRSSKGDETAGVVQKAEKEEKEWNDDKRIVCGMADTRVRGEKIGEEELVEGEGEGVKAELAEATGVTRWANTVKILVVPSFDAECIGRASIALVFRVIVVEAFSSGMILLTHA